MGAASPESKAFYGDKAQFGSNWKIIQSLTSKLSLGNFDCADVWLFPNRMAVMKMQKLCIYIKLMSTFSYVIS